MVSCARVMLPRYNRSAVMAINVMFYGLGPIGAAVARQVATRKGFKIAGGIDIDPAKIGRDLGDVIGFGKKLKRARHQRRGGRAQDARSRTSSCCARARR